MGVYSNFIMDQLSKDNYRLKKENDYLKDITTKFISGEYKKERLINKFQSLIE